MPVLKMPKTAPPSGQKFAAKRLRRKSQAAEPIAAPQEDKITFPFLQLPGEIRNMIYEYLLVDHDYSIRTEGYISKLDRRCIVRRLYRARPGPPDRDDLPQPPQRASLSKPRTSWNRIATFEQFSFVCAILQTCHQINEEAAPILYGRNLFVSETITSIHTFLTYFTRRLPLVRKLGLANTQSLLFDSENLSITLHIEFPTLFSLLRGATNLQTLSFSPAVWRSLSTGPVCAANRFYNEAYTWLLAMVVQKRDPLVVIKMPGISTKQLFRPMWSITKAGQDVFLGKVRRMLAKASGEKV